MGWYLVIAIIVAIVAWRLFRKKPLSIDEQYSAIQTSRPNELASTALGEPSRQAHVVAARSEACAVIEKVKFITLGGSYRVMYGDVDGVVTEREIVVQSTAREFGKVYILAFCSLRGAQRTFRADRMLSMVALPSRAVVDEPIVAASRLAEELSRPDPEHSRVLSRARAGLSVLIWIARSDREISSDEASILLDFIEERSSLSSKVSAASWSRAKAAIFIDEARPTHADAAGALVKMPVSGKEFPMVERYARLIVASGGAGAERRFKQLF